MIRIISRHCSSNKESAKLIYGFDKDTTHLYQLEVTKTKKRGVDVLKDPLINKGTAFNYSERERLGVRGLLPPRVQTIDMQIKRNQQYLSSISMPDSEATDKEIQDLQLYKDH